MPSIRHLHETTSEVTINYGNGSGAITILLRARMERISSGNEEYAVLRQKDIDLTAENSRLVQQIPAIAQEIAALKKPGDERFILLRNTLTTCLSEALRSFEESDSITAENQVRKASTALQEFDAEILPTDEELAAREAEYSAQLKEIEAKTLELSKQVHGARAERLVHLLDPANGWDLTDGEGDEEVMWPITVDNVATFPPELLGLMLHKIESEVGGGPF